MHGVELRRTLSELRTRKPTARSRPGLLYPEDRIIFSSGMGGLGQIVTVKTVSIDGDIASIFVEEQPGAIEVLTHNTVKVVI